MIKINPFLPAIVEHLSFTGHWGLDPLNTPYRPFLTACKIILSSVQANSDCKDSETLLTLRGKILTNRGKTLFPGKADHRSSHTLSSELGLR